MFVVIHAMTAQAANIIAVTDGQSLAVFDGTPLVLLQALRLGTLLVLLKTFVWVHSRTTPSMS
jgi:hypothetical protein